MSDQMKKNVLYVGGFELPDKNAAAHRVVSNGKIIKELGYDIFFAGISHNQIVTDNILKTKEIRGGRTEYHIKYPRSSSEWLNYLTSIRDIKQIIERDGISIVIAYNFPAIALFKLYTYCKARNIPLFSDCTEWEVSGGGNLFFKIIKGIDTFIRMRLVHPRLNGIIAISKYLQNYYSPLNKNVILVPPLVDLEDDKWNNRVDAAHNSYPVLTFAGSLGQAKEDLGMLFRSLSTLKKNNNIKFKMNVIGFTIEEYFNLNIDEPIQGELTSDITFRGRLTNQRVISIIQSSDFTIFIREKNRKTLAGFPTKFVESLASGTPVLTNESSDLKDYLIDGYNGYFLDASSESGLTDSLKNILTKDYSSIKELKKNCISSREFDFRRYIGTFNQLFLNINDS